MALFDAQPKTLAEIDADLRKLARTERAIDDRIRELYLDKAACHDVRDALLDVRVLAARNLDGVPGASQR